MELSIHHDGQVLSGWNLKLIIYPLCILSTWRVCRSGQEILGGSELEVLESYSLAVTNDLMVWLMVVENENQTNRVPAAVGVICASDANDAETRVLSPQEQTEINNIFQQFITIRTTQITNITQVINIINNVTTNGTGTTTPTNDTGGNGTGGPIIHHHQPMAQEEKNNGNVS